MIDKNSARELHDLEENLVQFLSKIEIRAPHVLRLMPRALHDWWNNKRANEFVNRLNRNK